MPSHFLNQCWVIANWTLRNRLQWNFSRNTKFFMNEYATENITCKTAAICPGGDELTWKLCNIDKICGQYAVIPGQVINHVGFHRAFNSLRPRQNGRYSADDIFKCIFLKENVWIPTIISLKFVPKGPINNIPALVQIMAWRRPRRQAIIWTNVGICTDAYMRHSASMS